MDRGLILTTSPLFFYKIGDKMGKHHDKIKEALEIRIKNTPNRGGFNTPGSMNKRKTGLSRRGRSGR